MITPPVDPEFEALLDYLRRSRGFDFTGYKRSSLTRRIQKRMHSLGVERYSDYLDHLEVRPDEFVHLFNTILINVTGFFRDAAAWDYVAEQIVPRILGIQSPSAPIRVWSAGCASGEEAYSAAILLAEALGPEAFQERVKIYGTDVDEEALLKARSAAYTAREAQGLSADRLERYFELSAGRYVFNNHLRRSVIFGRHDLIQDAPISRVDLLICRNTLMYFNADTQNRILARFHFALNDTGYLFLGKAEMLLSQSNIFTPVDMHHRIFAKVPKANPRDRLLLMAQAGSEEAMNHLASQVRLRDTAFDAAPVAEIVLDHSGVLALANDRARRLFGLVPRDLGRPLQDLEVSYRPAELRSLIDQAYAERRIVVLRDVDWPHSPTGTLCLDVQVTPLEDATGQLLGVMIGFVDVTLYRRLQQELRSSTEALETAYEELQSSNEELETTNEELQSTVEELETTNEELQSTNEELETMNEELQSTNEELQTINEQLRQRSYELDQTNLFLNSILASMQDGVAVLDAGLRVQIWNRKAEELWGLRAEEVAGQNFLNLDIGLPVERLRPSLRTSLSGEAPESAEILDATNRRGKAIRCAVTSLPLNHTSGETRGVILLMEEAPDTAPA
jgi:two-component system, chemotaxis family, CheB/CheR fusion protein